MPLINQCIAGLYVLTDPAIEDLDDMLTRVDAALRGGASIIQYRDKSQDQVRRRREASAIHALCQRYGAKFIVNDDIELAIGVGADGVHLGRDDVDPGLARARLGPTPIIGVSCYNSLELAEQAAAAGADYIAFGSFYPSAIKPDAVQASLELLQEARQQLPLPIVAIGGIDAGNAGSLIEAGADAIAVVSSVFLAEDPYSSAKQLARIFHP